MALLIICMGIGFMVLGWMIRLCLLGLMKLGIL